MYTLADYGAMIADPRTAAYREALRRTVRPGDVVVDVGAGTGIFSLFSCQLGARKVYAIEPSECVAFARECAKRSGFGDRVVVIEDRSKNVTLPERADVLVSDLRGSNPIFGEHLTTIRDARERFLKPGGIQIPARDHLYIAPIEAPDFHRSLVEPWQGHGVDLSPCVEAMLHQLHLDSAAPTSPEQLLAPSVRWTTLDYRTIDVRRVSGTARFACERSGVIHALVGWFEAELAEGIGYSNPPGDGQRIYGRTLAPLAEPIAVERGEVLEVTLRATEVDGRTHHAWSGAVAGRSSARFKQSTLASMALHAAADARSAGLLAGRAVDTVE